MNLEDLLATTQVGQWHHHLAVKAARTQQRRVEDIGAVGGSDDDHALVTLKAVHFDQQLVQGLLTLIVTTTQTGTTVTANRIDLVDKDDAGGGLLGLFEHVTHTGGTDTDEHLHEIRARDGKERHLGLAGNGSGEQGLTGTRRADHQHTTGDLTAKLLKLAGITQELNQFDHVILGLFYPGHVVKGDLDLILAQHARTALAEGHCPTAAATALHLAHKEDPHPDQQQHREPGYEDLGQHALLGRGLGLDRHTTVEQIGDQARIIRREGVEALTIGAPAGDLVALDGDTLNPSILHVTDELGVLQRLDRLLLLSKVTEHRHQDEGDNNPEQDILGYIVQGTSSTLYNH